jgi:hypothetical protein
MEREAVREYVEHAQSIIDASPQMDEANTKAAVLRDFLDLIGWDIPANTQLEYSVKAFGKTYKVDYALVLEGAPVAFIEAKGVDTPLTDKHREKLAAYLKNEDVNWGVLTNGEEYEFYRRRVVDTKVKVNALADTKLQNLPERITILRAFTKDAIQTGNSEKIASRINSLKQARKVLESEKDRLATEVTGLLTDEISDTIATPAESQAKEMIDRLVQDIEREIDPDSGQSSKIKTESESEREIPENESSDRVDNAPFDTSGRYVVKFSNSTESIAAVSGRTQSKAMVKAANYLIQYHELINRIDIPWVPSQNKAIINDVPEWERADPVYKELVNGYYLDTKLNKSGKQREIRNMVGQCGLGVTFEGDW